MHSLCFQLLILAVELPYMCIKVSTCTVCVFMLLYLVICALFVFIKGGGGGTSLLRIGSTTILRVAMHVHVHVHFGNLFFFLLFAHLPAAIFLACAMQEETFVFIS